MGCGIHIGLIACMKKFYDIFGIHVGLIHYMKSRLLCALHELFFHEHIFMMFLDSIFGI